MGTVGGINKAESKDADGIGEDAALKTLFLLYEKRKPVLKEKICALWHRLFYKNEVSARRALVWRAIEHIPKV